MPQVLRHAWQARLRENEDFAQWRSDFALVTGNSVQWMEELDRSEALQPAGAVCAAVQSCAGGCRFCLKFRLSLAERAHREGMAWAVCDAGLREGVVVVRRGGVVAGYLFLGGCRAGEAGGREFRRAQHLLSRTLDSAKALMDWQRTFALARFVAEDTFLAALRLLQTGAVVEWPRRSRTSGGDSTVRPAVVQQALKTIRARALQEEIRLSEVAKECGLSPEHLSRLFRRHVGIGFQEYVARLRIEAACDRLSHSTAPVTEIAFACGFTSLAQFYRAFAKFTGTKPQAYRRSLSLIQTNASR